MLTVSSVSAYSTNYEVKTDNEAKKLPMRAVRHREPKQEMSDYDKKRRNAKIKSGIVTTATVLGSLGFVVLVALQLLSMRPKGGVLDVVTNEELAKHFGFDEMIMPPKIKEFWDAQKLKIKYTDFLKKFDTKNKGLAMLLYGPPGTGKTEGAFALKKWFGDKAIMARIDCTAFKDSFHGASEKKIISSLKEAKKLCKDNPNKKVIVLLDEMSIANKDDGPNSNLTKGMQDAFKEHFMLLLDEPNAIVIATTNHAQENVPLDTLLNPAIFDRFSSIMFFPEPCSDQFLNLWEKCAQKWEAAGIVEEGFYAKNLDQFKALSQEMEEGKASFRAFWGRIMERIKDYAVIRLEKEGVASDAGSITMEDITNAVNSCKKEGNWGVKLEEKEDAIQTLFKFLAKEEDAPKA